MRELTDSGCPWVGKIPENWTVKKVKFLIESGENGMKIGPYGSALKGKTLSDGPVKIYNQANLIADDFDFARHFISGESYKELQNYTINAGDILFSMMGTIGKCKIMPDNKPLGIMDSHLLKARLTEEVLPRFFLYAFDKDLNPITLEQLIFKSNGSIMNGLNSTIVKTTELAIPTLPEQHAIVAYLDEKCAAIDESIQKRKEIIEKLQEYRKAVITQAVFDPTRTNAETIKLKYIFDIVAGATPKSDIESFWDGSIRWVTPADYKSDDKYVSHGAKTITDAGYESCSTTLVPKGSLVVSKRAPVGTVAIAANELCTNQGCLSCIPRKDINSEFYYYVLYSMTEHMKTLASGTTFQEISQTSFMNMKVPYCNKAVQDAIVISLNEKCVKIGEMLSKQQAIIDKLEEYKKSIIYNAVTGKIDCRPS